MKLGKLLAAGKSIMNGHTEVSYRSSKQIYLPKFGSPKNPFRTDTPQTELRESAGGTSNESRPGPVRLAGEDMNATFNGDSELSSGPQSENSEKVQDDCPRQAIPQARETVSQPKPAPRSEATSSAPVGTSASSVAPRFAPSRQQKKGKDWKKFNPLSILRAALPGRKSSRLDNAARGQKGTATQTELSLDSVKVLHNDLSDVDVEVVPIKSRAGVPELPAPRKSWEFVGERLFGVEAT